MGIFQNKPSAPAQPTGGSGVARPPMFGGFGGTGSRSQGAYINRGTYILEVVKTVGLVSKRPSNKGNEVFVAELLVRAVVDAREREMDPSNPTKIRFEASNKVGDKVSYIQNVSKHGEMALANIKNLFVAISGSENPGLRESDVSPDDWDAALAEAVEPPGTKCAGTLVICRAMQHETAKGVHMVICTFDPYVPDTAEAVETPA